MSNGTKVNKLYLAMLLCAASFLLLQISVLLYPLEYPYLGKTISTLSAIKINGEWNFGSALTIPLSHFLLSSGIALFAKESKNYFINTNQEHSKLIMATYYVTLLGCLCIVIAALTPHGVPEPFGKVHRFFGIGMFGVFGISALLMIIFNFQTYSLKSPLTFSPIIFMGLTFLLIPTLYLLVEQQILPNSRLIPTYQKFGYSLFIVGMMTQMFLLSRHIKQTS